MEDRIITIQPVYSNPPYKEQIVAWVAYCKGTVLARRKSKTELLSWIKSWKMDVMGFEVQDNYE